MGLCASQEILPFDTGLIDKDAETKLFSSDPSKVTCDPAAVDVVLFHGGCPDGFTAAYIAWLKLGSQARYVGIGHGSPEHKLEAAGDLTGKHVAVLDFSFDAPSTAMQMEAAASYVVLDHHKTAAENLRGLSEENKVFQMNMSWATLSWDFFFRGQQCPLLFRYVEDKDIWRWALKNSKEFSAAYDLTAGISGPGQLDPEQDFRQLDR